MSTTETLVNDEQYQALIEQAQFEQLVTDILVANDTLSTEERKLLEAEPQMKPAGTMDQGYRHG